MSNGKNIKEELREKNKEINELKELLAEAETEIKEMNDFGGIQRPGRGILENKTLNKSIKVTAFVLACLILVLIGIYPWLSGSKLMDKEMTGETEVGVENNSSEVVADEESKITGQETTSASAPKEEIPAAPKKLFEVDSDLGWLNVRTEPSVETGLVIKKINSGEEYEWLEKTDNNWYKIVIDEVGHTGYVSGEYVVLK